MLKPSDVFTPARPPVEDTNVYALRGNAEHSLKKSIERGMIPLIFGEYGVGKTSLARRVSLEAEKIRKVVNIESVDGKTLSDVFARCLEHVGYATKRSAIKEQERQATLTAGGEGGFEFNAIKIGGKLEHGSTTRKQETEEWEYVVTSPSDSRVLEVCEKNELILILDEMHKASSEFVGQLSSFIKAYHNKPCKRFKVILVGTSSDASRLALRDPGIDRIIQEIRLGSMTESESEYIVKKGMGSLAISINDTLAKRLVRAAVGAPSIVQYLSLEVAESAFSRDPRIAASEDLEAAIDDYMKSRAARLNEAYVKAIETTGAKRYRKQILIAMAFAKNDFVTMEEIAKGVSKHLQEDVPSTALSGPLRDLKNSNFGQVLKDVERTEGDGDRVFNLTAFSDPSMKAFIRMRHEIETSCQR